MAGFRGIKDKLDGGELDHDSLKGKQRALRDGFPEAVALRVHRAISWIGRAEAAGEEWDAAFIFAWIAFNAAYADDTPTQALTSERSQFEDFFGKLIGLDRDDRIYRLIWDRFAASIRVILNNKFVYQPFWAHHNGTEGYADWETRFERNRERLHMALARKETKFVLCTLFDRLYVLRNQLVHGGATWGSKTNRQQVKDGARLLALLVPIYIDLMMENPGEEWGKPYYPVVDG
jgi:hypothetical protein